jgi:hypothetical protein
MWAVSFRSSSVHLGGCVRYNAAVAHVMDYGRCHPDDAQTIIGNLRGAKFTSWLDVTAAWNSMELVDFDSVFGAAQKYLLFAWGPAMEEKIFKKDVFDLQNPRLEPYIRKFDGGAHTAQNETAFYFDCLQTVPIPFIRGVVVDTYVCHGILEKIQQIRIKKENMPRVVNGNMQLLVSKCMHDPERGADWLVISVRNEMGRGSFFRKGGLGHKGKNGTAAAKLTDAEWADIFSDAAVLVDVQLTQANLHQGPQSRTSDIGKILLFEPDNCPTIRSGARVVKHGQDWRCLDCFRRVEECWCIHPQEICMLSGVCCQGTV